MRNQWHAFIRSPNRGVNFFPVYGDTISIALEAALDNLICDETLIALMPTDMSEEIRKAEPYVQGRLKI